MTRTNREEYAIAFTGESCEVALCDGAVLDDFGAVLDEASARGAAASLRKRVEVPRSAER